jgi:hypothetical protein
MFTLLVILFCFIELFYIVNLKGMQESNLNLIKANKEFKDTGISWKEYPEEYKNNLLSGCAKAMIMLIVLFGGLLTEQWLIWVSLLSINIVLVGPLNKLFRKNDMMIENSIVTWLNSLLGLGCGVLHIINEYHLHIDLLEFVQNFLK